ncbi:hypothetical protein [Pseudocitrobacter vendiensis]|uniref:Uncharacterized protein n=1 Tax=Pseudocitrobacter vendiensis TaxID=2488306 RepID=A0ABM9FAQ9_9ENTR|nr:hypothetical protein [Pseudocitrobacter vendiensis]CAH6659965.1 hypothetical protein FBBNIHIM_12635 [Pseudocitrobacter vendiensis]
MDEKYALKIVVDKLLGDDSIPVRLRLNKEYTSNEIESLYQALDFLAEYYTEHAMVPKLLSLALTDVYGMFSFRVGIYSEDKCRELEDIGIKLQDMAIDIFTR